MQLNKELALQRNSQDLNPMGCVLSHSVCLPVFTVFCGCPVDARVKPGDFEQRAQNILSSFSAGLFGSE